MTPRQWQYLLMGALVVTAVLLQLVVLARVPLPGPPLGLAAAVVIAIGMAAGSNPGAVAGFAAGLLLDVLPPNENTLGVGALALLCIGALAGRIRDPRGLAPVQLAAMAAGLAAIAWLVGQGLRWLLGDPVAPLLWSVWFAVGTGLLSLVVVPPVTAIIRRTGRAHRRPRRRRRRIPAAG